VEGLLRCSPELGDSSIVTADASCSIMSLHIQWKEAVAGAVSGALTVLALHPLDVIKTRLQVQESKPDRGFASRYKGAIHAFRVIQRREGIRGLYSGA
jgi:Mitochondrial carrier protein